MQVKKWLVFFIWLLLPSNLFLKFFVDQAYVHGFLVDYLLAKFYVSDIFILSLFLWWVWLERKLIVKNIKNIFRSNFGLRKKIFLIIGLVGFLAVEIMVAAKSIAAWWYGLKIIEFTVLTYFYTKNSWVWRQPLLLVALIISFIFEIGLATYQFIFQKELFGFWFFGEPQLKGAFALARSSFGGTEKILSYGTLPHPNILAGWIILTGFLIVSLLRKNFHQKFNQIIPITIYAVLSLLIIYMTQSLSAALSLIMALIILMFPKIKLPAAYQLLILSLLSVPLISLGAHQWPNSSSLIRRQNLNLAATDMWLKHPILGVGLNNFTVNLDNSFIRREVVNFLQPVHQIFLLILSETGLVGVALVIFLLYQQRTNNSLSQLFLILLPIISLDHYLLTQNTGLSLLSLLFAFALIS